MKRTARLTSDPDKVRAFHQRGRGKLARTGPPRADARTDDERWAEEQVRLAVFARDRGCQLPADAHAMIGPCSGGRAPHHRRKASAGGSYTEANLVELCGLANNALEYDAALAEFVREHHPRFIVREGDDEWEQLGRRWARDHNL